MKVLTNIIVIALLVTINLAAQVKETNTDWSTIKNSDGKMVLNQVKAWGTDMNNMAEAFNSPSDICMDKEGNYYIVDSGNNQIIIFDKNGKPKNKIGKSGQGPGDFGYPTAIRIDKDNNIVVAESGNNRVQVLLKDKKSKMINPANVYFSNMEIDKNNRIILTRGYSNNGSAKLYMFDYNENQIGSIGAITKPKDEYGRLHYTDSPYSFCIDKEGNIYIAYRYGEPVIEKYSPDGKMLMKIKYKLSTSPKEPPMPRNGKPTEILAGSGSLAVDDNGNIYIVALKRNLNEDDIKHLSFTVATMRAGSDGSGTDKSIRKEAAEKQKEKYDFNQLIVFDKNGNLKGSKSLDYVAGQIRAYNGYLFIFDTNEASIHQYQLPK